MAVGYRGGTTVGVRQPMRGPKKDEGDKPTTRPVGYRGGTRAGPQRSGQGQRPPASGAPSPRGDSPKSYPGVGAKAREAASKAKVQADAYATYQRAANKLKRKIKANSGPTDLAGRTQRAIDLKRMRGIQKEADRRKKMAQDAGLRMGSNASGGSSGGGSSSGGSKPAASAGGGGGGTAASGAVARAASGGSKPKSENSTKVGSVLSAARKQRQETTGTPITAKELANFTKFYNKTHKGTLSREDAVLMARMLKRKSPAVAKKYGLNVAQEG